MTALLSTTNGRITFAIALSLLLHTLILWLPQIELPRSSKLPPLTAHLEAVHHDVVVKKIPKRKPKPKTQPPAPLPESVAVAPIDPLPLAVSDVLPASAVAESSVESASAVMPASAAIASAPAAAEPAPVIEEKPTNRPPLPRHAELRYAVYKGTSSFRIGESLHTLDIDDGRYQIKAVTETVGLVSLFKSYKVIQQSSGVVDKQGLHPGNYSEERIESLGKQVTSAEFDTTTSTARFSHGGTANLPPDLQDVLSMLYQFPPLPMGAESVTVTIGNSKKIENYEFGITYNDVIETPLGLLHTVHFTKLHGTNVEGLELWIAQEYRFLPVKLSHIERDGTVSAEVVITDIRVLDE